MPGFIQNASRRVLGITLCIGLLACNTQQSIVQVPGGSLPPLSTYMSCMPEETAIIAAHRGTDRNTAFPENSLSGLEALIAKNYLMAEVDIAGLKDGTHILYHDGVWEEKSTGRGAVASSTAADIEKILLRDWHGKLSADRPPLLDDFLARAKGKIYLEIDFKSSAKYSHVIDALRRHNMQDQVLLIAYNLKQAQALHHLGPEFLISATIRDDDDLAELVDGGLDPTRLLAWQSDHPRALSDKRIKIIARLGSENSAEKAGPTDILVTDYAFSFHPLTMMDKNGHEGIKACLEAAAE